MCSKRLQHLSQSFFLLYWVLSWYCNFARFKRYAAILFLCLISLSISAQESNPISQISIQDLTQYNVDLGILVAQRDNYKQALTNAINLTESIKRELQKVTQDSKDYQTSLSPFLIEQTQTIASLMLQLKDSESLVQSLKVDLLSKEAEYLDRLNEAGQKARSLEAWTGFLAILAIVAGLEAVYIGLHVAGAVP